MKSPLEIIAATSKVPDYTASAIKGIMKRLDMDERAFALIMNVTPSTIRLWTSGTVKPCGTAKRLMQVYGVCPDLVTCIVDDEKAKSP